MRIFLECGIALMLSLILCLGSRSGFCHPCSILSRLPHRSLGWSAATSSPDRSTDWACMNLYHLTETAVGFGGSILPIWSSAGKKDSHSFDNRPISESSLWTKGNSVRLFFITLFYQWQEEDLRSRIYGFEYNHEPELWWSPGFNSIKFPILECMQVWRHNMFRIKTDLIVLRARSCREQWKIAEFRIQNMMNCSMTPFHLLL